jgi:hypothetical protein
LSSFTAKEKKGDLIVSRKAAGSIAKWNNKAAELRKVAPAAAPPSAIKPVLTPESAQAATSLPVLAQTRSFSSFERVLTCFFRNSPFFGNTATSLSLDRRLFFRHRHRRL